MESRKIIVAFENNLTPKKALGTKSFEVTFNRLYSIENIVSNFKAKNIGIAENYKNDELLFQEEIIYNLPKEEQNVYSTFISGELEYEKAMEIFDELEDNENVKFVQFDEENELYDTPEDPYYSQQWGLQKINCEQA